MPQKKNGQSSSQKVFIIIDFLSKCDRPTLLQEITNRSNNSEKHISLKIQINSFNFYRKSYKYYFEADVIWSVFLCNNGYHTRPVSYTHLDVYKRQR